MNCVLCEVTYGVLVALLGIIILMVKYGCHAKILVRTARWQAMSAHKWVCLPAVITTAVDRRVGCIGILSVDSEVMKLL